MESKTILLGTVIVAALVLAVAVMAKLPGSQCYQLASNIDNVVQNVNPEFIDVTYKRSPCTGENITSYLYSNRVDAPLFGRRVFVNDTDGPDVRGWTTKTGYVLCSDGRAKVENLSLFHLAFDACDIENPGFPFISTPCYGLQHNPVVSWLNYYVMEQCSTMG